MHINYSWFISKAILYFDDYFELLAQVRQDRQS